MFFRLACCRFTNDIRMDVRPPFLIFLLYLLYRRIPQLLPYSARSARWGVITVLVLITPYSVYCTIRGYPAWSPEQPVWRTVLGVMGGAGHSLYLFGELSCCSKMPDEDRNHAM